MSTRYRIPVPLVNSYNGPATVVKMPSSPHVPIRLLHLGKFFWDRNLLELIDIVVDLEGKAVLTLRGWGEAEKAIRERIAHRTANQLVSLIPPCSAEEVPQEAMERRGRDQLPGRE